MNTPKPPLTIQPNPTAARFDQVHEGIWEIVRRNHRPGESDLETAERMLINEALGTYGGCQAAAAKALGITDRLLNYKCANLRVRPIDVNPNPAHEKRGRKPKLRAV